jgi:hypothetical protein
VFWSTFLSITAIVVSLIIGVWQIIMQRSQGAFQEKMLHSQNLFMREQAEIIEMSNQQWFDKEANSFIRTHSHEKSLIPLAVIAQMYNAFYPYQRKVYEDFMCLEYAVQSAVLDKLSIGRLINCSEDLWGLCSETLEHKYTERFPGDINLFYDNAKYVERTLHYGAKPIPEWHISLPKDISSLTINHKKTISTASTYEDVLTDVLISAFKREGDITHPGNLLFGNLLHSEGGILGSDEESEFDGMKKCYSDCMLAYWFAEYYGSELERNDPSVFEYDEYKERVDYGAHMMVDYFAMNNMTMEDLFLRSLLSIYVNLVVPSRKNALLSE